MLSDRAFQIYLDPVGLLYDSRLWSGPVQQASEEYLGLVPPFGIPYNSVHQLGLKYFLKVSGCRWLPCAIA